MVQGSNHVIVIAKNGSAKAELRRIVNSSSKVSWWLSGKAYDHRPYQFSEPYLSLRLEWEESLALCDAIRVWIKRFGGVGGGARKSLDKHSLAVP